MVGLTCAFAVGCGGGSSSSSSNNNSSSNSSSSNTIATSGPNVAAIAVNGGPPGINYVDAAFISVTVCTPGTTTCQTIPNILVDTGSVGLRILSSQLTVSLTQQKASDGNPMAECLQFLNSYTWGPVQTGDVQISGETASSVPIQVLSDTTPGFPTPTSCSDPGSQESSADNLDALGAYGILGVGSYAQDCGGGCVQADNQVGTSPLPFYYECPAGSCVPAWENLAQQVTNPVALFATDNNGVIVELPSVAADGQASATGALVFGIGTQSNNALGSATVYSIDFTTGNFTTTFNSTVYTDESFLDTGSNGYYFQDSSIPPCSDNPDFYCPTIPVNLTATNQGTAYQGTGTGSGTVNFTIGNADTLTGNALSELGGTVITDGSGPANYFDWGLPFFFGRNVFVSIYGTTAPGGTTPYWAY
jgi:hypothetical protein